MIAMEFDLAYALFYVVMGMFALAIAIAYAASRRDGSQHRK